MENQDSLVNLIMLAIRGLIEGLFEVYYSMSCFSLIFYFSIMYKYLLNASVYKQRNDAAFFIPIFTVFVPFLFSTFEYFFDTISFLNFKDLKGDNQDQSEWVLCLIINLMFIFSNFFLSFSDRGENILSIPLFNWSKFSFQILENVFYFIILQLFVYLSVQSIGNQKFNFQAHID